MTRNWLLKVAVDVPWRGGAGDGLFDYWPPVNQTADETANSSANPTPNSDWVGRRVVVPWAQRRVMGLVMAWAEQGSLPADKIRPAFEVLDDIPALGADWLRLVQFAARYYKHSPGEVALQSLPPALKIAEVKLADGKRPLAIRRALKKLAQGARAEDAAPRIDSQPRSTPPEAGLADAPDLPRLNAEQAAALEQMQTQWTHAKPVLLHGITGSGKTEVYLRLTAHALAQRRQVLVLVPEINLTPQLLERFTQRFPQHCVATLHSELAAGARLHAWLAAATGQADIVLGTRLAVLAPLPRLGLIVVDEEHDPSYKQQEGVHYSARDLAVWRAKDLNIPVVLGSATPSLESWQHAQQGKYQRLVLSQRAVGGALPPQVQLIDTARDKTQHGLTQALRSGIENALQQNQQVLLFLNRRGYAPALNCDACGWVAGCPRCSAYVVMHTSDQRLHCHHCGWQAALPRACPSCGNHDLAPVGRGTQRLEDSLASLYPQARLARLDADTAKRKGSAQALLTQVHAGEVDIVVGTQMMAKGHDFANVGLVGVVNADAALFSHDFRAAERLFAQLHQVIGRAGRSASSGRGALALVQTRYPQHPLYQALAQHDTAGFAQFALSERRDASLPPFTHQALLRAQAPKLMQTLEFLNQARTAAPEILGVQIYDAVPLALMRVAHQERAQVLVEAASRAALQTFLEEWLAILITLKTSVRWRLEIDPLTI